MAVAHAARGLDHINMHGFEEPRPNLRSAEDVGHQRPAAWTQFDEIELRRPAHRFPGVDQPAADQFSKNLADLRRGCEIARGSQRFLRGVIAVLRMDQGIRHEVADPDRAMISDQVDQPLFQRCAFGPNGFAHRLLRERS